MLNPPLALLSDDLIGYIVEHVAALSSMHEALHNLSLADRAFTESCQKYIFHTLILGKEWSRSRISTKLKKLKRILDEKPLLARRVRKVYLFMENRENSWLFQYPSGKDLRHKDAVTFISFFQLFAYSPVLPHELHITMGRRFPLEDPTLVLGRLSESFFSQTLTILHLTGCDNVPLPLFLLCPRLKEVHLDNVGAEEHYNGYPDEQCSGRESPALEFFDYCGSHTVIRQMISPPKRFRDPVVLWSMLRVLKLSPHEGEAEMALLRPILDAACNTLEELYLTNLHAEPDEHLSLSGFANLSKLSRLRVFALYAIIACDTAGPSGVLRDIKIVLSTIPESNKITNLSFEFDILGEQPFGGCLDEDWVGMCDEVIRISSGKHLEVDVKTAVSRGTLVPRHGEDELYGRIMERMMSLSDHLDICLHFWNPTYWSYGLTPFPRGQVRSRCRT